MCPEDRRESWNRSARALGSSLTGGPKGGAVESQKPRQSRDLEGRKQKNLHFSAHDFSSLEQLGDCGPNQTEGSGNQEKPIETLQYRGQAWVAKCGMAYKTSQCTQPLWHQGQARVPREGRHTNLGQCTQLSPYRGSAWGAKRRTHKPRDKEGWLER